MKNLKKAIIIIFIIIIIILITLLVVNFIINPKNNSEQNIIGDIGEQIDYETVETEEVSDSIKFYTVKNCINQYLDTINVNNTSYYRVNENGQNERIIAEQDIKKKIYNLLDTDFIEEKGISVDNVYDYVYKVDQKLSFTPLKMNVLVSPTVEKYAAYGYIQNLDNNYTRDIYIIVNLDFQNKTFSIEQVQAEYSDLSELKLNKKEENIEKNEDNTYVEQKITDEFIANQYFSVYKKMLQTKPELAYDYLNEEYRNERFNGNVDLFKQYIQKNITEIDGIQFKEYLINTYKEYREIVCKDQYENLYIFKETNPMIFELELDDYTLDYKNEEYLNEYNSSTDQYKVANNINKWIKMLNNRDYQAAYNVLDESFRERFGGEEGFETYMRKAFPLHYEIEYGEFTEESGIYTQKITLTDITGESDGKIIKTILMDLGEGTDFVMSFNTTRADISR